MRFSWWGSGGLSAGIGEVGGSCRRSGWLGAWFELYPDWETLAAQALAATFVIGSYVLARELKRPRPRAVEAAVE